MKEKETQTPEACNGSFFSERCLKKNICGKEV